MRLLSKSWITARGSTFESRNAVEKSWRETKFVALDVETTGLDPQRDQIVSVGAVPIVDGRVIVRDAHYSLVRSRCPIPARSTRIHTIRNQDLSEAPSLTECVLQVDSLLREAVVVAHSSSIERAFLRRAFRDAYLGFDFEMIDTAKLAKPLLAAEKRVESVPLLEDLARSLGVPIHTPHHALGDALTTAEVFLVAASKLESTRELSTKDLICLSM